MDIVENEWVSSLLLSAAGANGVRIKREHKSMWLNEVSKPFSLLQITVNPAENVPIMFSHVDCH